MTAERRPPRQLETIDSAAARCAVDGRTIRRRIADGTITAYRVAGRKAIRVDPVEVDAKLILPIPTVGGSITGYPVGARRKALRVDADDLDETLMQPTAERSA